MLHRTHKLPTVDKPTTARKRTFTLIEMLVVVVIIGILAVALIPRLVGAKERASDSARIVKIGQISSAVELYAQEKGTTYPLAPLTTTGTSIARQDITDAISPYLTTIPTDPGKGTVAIDSPPSNIQVTGDSFAYWTNTGGTVYAITALMESKKGNTTNATQIIDSDKQGGYQKVGKGLTTKISIPGVIDTSEPGVYHDVANQEIIVTNGTTTYVIADKNAGATVAGTDHTNPAIRGFFFQWGNNFGFSSDPTVTLDPASTTQVNTDGLTTYTSGTWIYDPSFNLPRGDWSSNQNDDLRGNITNTDMARKGPCEDGYHVPTYDEWQGLVDVRKSIPGKSYDTEYYSDGEAYFNSGLFGNDLLLPIVGFRRFYYTPGSVLGQGSYANYWLSTTRGVNADYLYFDSIFVYASYYDLRLNGMPVRCFKNSQ